MKKFILLIALSALFYSAPGYTGGDLSKPVAPKEAAAPGPSKQGTRREILKATLAAAPEATVERRKAAAAALAAALAETQEETVARSVASLAALAEATVVRRQAAEAAEATGAPATEAAPTRASLERLKECVGSLAQTALAHAQGVSTVLKDREDALNKHLIRLDAMTHAIVNRYKWQPLKLMMSQEEIAKDEGVSRSADIVSYAFSIQAEKERQRDANLADLAQDKQLVREITNKALALQSGEVTPEEVWQAGVQEALPVEAEEEAFAAEVAAAERAEAEKVGALQALCARIEDNGYRLPPGVQRHEVVALAEETLSEMGNILSEMDLDLMEMWKGKIAYYKEVFVLSAILRSTVEGDPELVTVEGDYVAASRCYEALLEQAAKEGSYTPESTETSFDDAKALFRRCTELMSDVSDLYEKTDRDSSEYIASSQERFDSLMERGISLVETFLDPLPLVKSEGGVEGPETPTAQKGPAAAPPAVADDGEDPA